MKRRTEFDVARGLMLVLMTLTHLPTRFSDPAGQPFGYVSAAEGFVLLSAFMAGMVYAGKAMKDGLPAMRRAFLGRALTVYACQAALLLFLFTIIAAIGITIDQPAVKNLMSFYLAHPLTGLWSGLLLIYSPPLLDILPLYIFLLLASPWVLAWGLQHGWGVVLGASLALWALAQFGLSAWLYAQLVALTGLPVPFKETGSFEMFAWQWLWVLGLWMGARMAAVGADGEAFTPLPRGWLVAAGVYAALFFVWRHVVGQVPVATTGPSLLNTLFDKWHLAPLRLLNFLALLVLAMRFGPPLLARLPRLRWLVLLGTQSLPVFCAHLVAVLLVLLFLGGVDPQRAWWIDALVLAATFAGLSAVAWMSRELDRQAQELQQRRQRRRLGVPDAG